MPDPADTQHLDPPNGRHWTLRLWDGVWTVIAFGSSGPVDYDSTTVDVVPVADAQAASLVQHPDPVREALAPFAVPRGQEHPSWSRYSYLCGQCGEVSYADDWLAFKYDDEGELIPAEEGDSDPIIRCPICKTDHKDADDDSGVWDGTRKAMYAERETQLSNPIMADVWIDFWKERATLADPPLERVEEGERDARFPVKLDGGYTCQGLDRDGERIVFDDLLNIGDRVASVVDEEGNQFGPFGIVVQREDGLWIEAESPARVEQVGEAEAMEAARRIVTDHSPPRAAFAWGWDAALAAHPSLDREADRIARRDFNAECPERPGVSIGEDLVDKWATQGMKIERLERELDRGEPT